MHVNKKLTKLVNNYNPLYFKVNYQFPVLKNFLFLRSASTTANGLEGVLRIQSMSIISVYYILIFLKNFSKNTEKKHRFLVNLN